MSRFNRFLLILALTTETLVSDSLGVVKKFYFRGNREISTKVLKQVILLKPGQSFSDFELEKSINNIKSLYKDYGFYAVHINHEIKSTSHGEEVWFIINEGPRIQIETINFIGAHEITKRRGFNFIDIRKGDYLILSKVKEACDSLMQWYKNNGYPFANIEYQIDYSNDKANISFFIKESSKVYLRKVIVRGNKRVSENIIRRVTELKAGELFSLLRITEARQRIYATKLFERVQFYIITPTIKDSVDIRFDVIELPARGIGLGVGFQTPPSSLVTSVEWQHYNFLKKGHNFSLTLDFTPYFTGDFGIGVAPAYRIFYFLNTPLDIYWTPKWNYEKRESLKQHFLNIELAFIRRFNQQFLLGAILKYLQNWANYSLVTNKEHEAVINSQTIYIKFDSRNRPFLPTRGHIINAGIEYAGGIFQGSHNFYKTEAEWIFLRQFFTNLVLANRLKLGFILPFGRTSTVPYYTLFWLGGNNGLRGYDDKSVGPVIVAEKYHYGEALVNWNLELRTNFKSLWNFVIFYDFGKLTNRKELLNFDYYLLNYALGVGLRVNTPLGPFRCDYAKRLHTSPPKDWGKIHLGLLNFF
jgi:outer membrane protein insertion porin family